MEKPLPVLAKQTEISKRELLPILQEARRRVSLLLRNSAKNRHLVRSGNAQRSVYKGISAVYDRLKEDLDVWAKEVAGRTGVQFVERALKDTGANISFERFSRKYAHDYFNYVNPQNTVSIAAAKTEAMKISDVRQLREAVTSTFRLSSVSGMTARETQAELAKQVNALVGGGLESWKFIDAGGRVWDSGNYFNMLTRTINTTVARESYIDTLQNLGQEFGDPAAFDLAVLEGGGDPCEACAEWRGVVLSISGDSDDYDSVDDAIADGVFHPNCACELRYITPKDARNA